MVGNVFELVWMKTHDGNELAKLKCRIPCFLQKNGVSVNEGVLKVKGSCSRSVGSSGKCLQSLLLLVLAVM